MGGYGSGRWGAGPTVESAPKIRLYDALRGQARAGIGHVSMWTWSNHYSDEVSCRVLAAVELDSVSPHVTILHLGSADLQDVVDRYRVDLDSTVQPLGGRRWWFLCPRTGERVAALYLPLGARRFASAGAYRLAYQSQRSTARDRAIGRAHKIRRRLGADVNPLVEVEKPHRMRWSTFDREMARLKVAEGAANAHLWQVVQRLQAMARR